MKLPHRRQFLHLAAGTAALPAVSRIARAQSYPTQPVRIVVGFPPGGSNDIIARLFAQWLSERFGQPFLIENRPGASGNVAVEAVVKAPPDGYTLLLLGTPNIINASLFDKLDFNLLRDIAPIASTIRTSFVLEVNPSVPVNTVNEFISYAKANPGKISYASVGIGTPPQVASEMFRIMTGIDMRQVQYRGAEAALADLLSGKTQAMIDNTVSSIEYIKNGKLRPLAVTTTRRVEALPETPTMSEFVPGYDASGLQGIGAPKDTPADIIDKLNREINAGLTDPKVKARLADLGGMPLALSPAAFGKLVADEVEKWGKVIRAANIKPG